MRNFKSKIGQHIMDIPFSLTKKNMIIQIFLFCFIIPFILTGFSQVKTTKIPGQIVINYDSSDSTCTYAFNELKYFLNKAGVKDIRENTDAGTADSYLIQLRTDEKLKPYSFRVEYQSKGNKKKILLSGNNSTCVLHAVYTMLEKIGYTFEITGPVENDIDFNKLSGYKETITPSVLNRGIRLHLNFPMDISSYSLEDAKEYIRNLARMRFNSITFHSYVNQWIEGPQKSRDTLAGHFFYGINFPIPDSPSVYKKHIDNKSFYCIPEIEPFYNQPIERSHLAVQWLQQVMKEAKKVGMTIQFSFEPREIKPRYDLTIKTAQRILQDYPLVDKLELISDESAGDLGKIIPRKEAEDILTSFFDSSVLKIKSVQEILKSPQRGFIGIFGDVCHNINAVKLLLQNPDFPAKIKLCTGVYCITPKYMRACLDIMEKYNPPQVSMALLPGHSAQRVANYVREIGIKAEEWKRIMMYSWLEFDGLMFVQQNGLAGNRMLIEDAQKTLGGRPIPAICFNVWRTSENRTNARFASLITLNGKLNEKDFYNKYALNLGIGSRENYAEAMNELNKADWKMTTSLPNFGFCWSGSWGGSWGESSKDGRRNIGYFGMWPADSILFAKQQFEDARKKLAVCIKETQNENGKKYLSFLDNRLRTTIIYMKAMQKGTELQPLFLEKETAKFTKTDRDTIVRLCNESLALLYQCVDVFSEAMPDRGCQGTLISYYYTPRAYLLELREKFGLIPQNGIIPKDTRIDEPPSPN
jgi:hypothetical protein